MNKQETLAALIAARGKLVRRARRLPAKKRDEVFLGVWSARDLLAHLVGWDYANIESVSEIRAGKTPQVFAHWNPNWSAFNKQLVKTYKRDSWTEMLRLLEDSHQALIECLQAVPDEDFEKDFGVRSPRGRNITVSGHLEAEIEDEQTHFQQLKNWMDG